jgi:hypothetical protein
LNKVEILVNSSSSTDSLVARILIEKGLKIELPTTTATHAPKIRKV